MSEQINGRHVARPRRSGCGCGGGRRREKEQTDSQVNDVVVQAEVDTTVAQPEVVEPDVRTSLYAATTTRRRSARRPQRRSKGKY